MAGKQTFLRHRLLAQGGRRELVDDILALIIRKVCLDPQSDCLLLKDTVP
jgi:hypothetical protein